MESRLDKELQKTNDNWEKETYHLPGVSTHTGCPMQSSLPRLIDT